MSAEELGRLQEIPHGFLQAILADLRRAGDRDLPARPVRRLADGARRPRTVIGRRRDPRRRRPAGLASTACAPRRSPTTTSAEVLQHVWIAARSSLRDVFEQVSIQQLADGKLPKAVTSRTADEDAWQPH